MAKPHSSRRNSKPVNGFDVPKKAMSRIATMLVAERPCTRHRFDRPRRPYRPARVLARCSERPVIAAFQAMNWADPPLSISTNLQLASGHRRRPRDAAYGRYLRRRIRPPQICFMSEKRAQALHPVGGQRPVALSVRKPDICAEMANDLSAGFVTHSKSGTSSFSFSSPLRCCLSTLLIPDANRRLPAKPTRKSSRNFRISATACISDRFPSLGGRRPASPNPGGIGGTRNPVQIFGGNPT